MKGNFAAIPRCSWRLSTKIYSSSIYYFGPFPEELPEWNIGKNPDFSFDGDFKPKNSISDSYNKLALRDN